MLLLYRNCTSQCRVVAAAAGFEPGERYMAEWQNPEEKLKHKKENLISWCDGVVERIGPGCTPAVEENKEVGPQGLKEGVESLRNQ